MPLTPNVVIYAVHPQGEYTCFITDIKADTRPSFNDASKQESCFKWTFTTDKKDEQGNDIKFFLTTGTTYGGSRATLTKVTNSILGRALDKKTEASTFDYETLIGLQVKLLITKETDDKGEFFNKIAGVSPVVTDLFSE